MTYKFAIMIISHKRADTQLTYETLMRTNYTGAVYILVDDEDPQLEDYIKNYGDIVKVFNKDKMLEITETVDNFQNKTNCVLPSTYCRLLAEELKLDYYMRIDDDISSIRERYVENGKLKGRDIKNIDKIFNAFIKYMENTNISCLSFGNEGGYIGGANGKFKKEIGRNNNQNFIMKTKDDLHFIGTRSEDFCMIANYSKVGKLIYEIYKIAIRSPERGSNEGGLQDDYAKAGLYVANFYGIIVAPYCCKIIERNNKFTLKRDWDKFGPMLISEEYKK